MIKGISECIVKWQVKKGYLLQSDSALYQYAYEILISQMINILIAIIIAIFFHSVIYVALFLLSYIPLRTFSGGIHHSTNEGCTVISALTLVLICMILRIFPKEYMQSFCIVSAFLSSFAIYFLSPVEDKNKPLDEVEVKRYKSISRIVWGIETILGFFLIYSNLTVFAFLIFLSHLLSGMNLILGVWKNKHSGGKG